MCVCVYADIHFKISAHLFFTITASELANSSGHRPYEMNTFILIIPSPSFTELNILRNCNYTNYTEMKKIAIRTLIKYIF